MEEEKEETPLSGVILARKEDADGNISVDVFPNGDVKADQVATLIEIGLKSWRARIGLS